jgi:alpha-ribazole phosphatase
MQTYLIRHGETAGNAEHRYIGRTDEPLSAAGRALAEQAPKDLSLPLVYVSPMRRARETASILFPNARQQVIYDLREMDFGIFEGRSPAEMEHDPAYRSWTDSMCLDPCPGGESKALFQERAVNAFAEAIRYAKAQNMETAVFVTHGGIIMAILEALALPKQEFYSYYMPNLGGWAAECTEKKGQQLLRCPRRISLRSVNGQ